MKCYQIQHQGSFDNIKLVHADQPKAGAHQVLIKVRAVSLNSRDLMIVGGKLGPLSQSPLIPVSDGAGEVVEVGAGTSRFAPGDRVVAIFRQNWICGGYEPADVVSDLGGGKNGMLSEFVVLEEQGLLHLPPQLSFEEGATLPCAASLKQMTPELVAGALLTVDPARTRLTLLPLRSDKP